MPIAMPPGYHPTQTVRQVNPAYQHIRSWISSVGAGVALADVTGHGRADGMCIVDPRTNDVVVTYAPFDPSGIRLGTPAVTTRGLREEHMEPIAAWIDEAITAAAKDDEAALDRIAAEVRDLLTSYPIPGWDGRDPRDQ
jgi:hypothetical protein